MKVLQVINSLDTGGAERLLSGMAPLLDTRGVRACVFILRLQEQTLYDRLQSRGIEVVVSKHRSIYSAGNVSIIRKLVETKSIDLVHAHLFPAFYWVAQAAPRFSGVPIVTTEHNTWNRRRRAIWRPLDRFVYSRYQRVVCVSPQTSESLRSWLPETSDRIRVIENGIDSTEYCPADVSYVPPRTVITVGRLTKQKGFDVLIKATARLPGVKLSIVGDGPLRGDLEALAASLNIHHRVQFLGNRNDVPELLRSAMIYVQPSAWEGFGIAAVEAMCTGLPTIVSDVAGLREVVGSAGMRFTPGSHTELAESLRILLSDENLRRLFGERARLRAMQFALARTVDRYVELYKEVCGCIAHSAPQAKFVNGQLSRHTR